MDKNQSFIELLPVADWLALAWFIVAWVGYAQFADRQARNRHSILVLTNRERRNWMWRSTFRENRVFDGVIVQNLSASPSFFASTTILIIGGVLAVLGAGTKASQMVQDLPFAVRTTGAIVEIKLFVLLAIFVYAFFRFTWSLRLYSFGALLVGSAPESHEFTSPQMRDAFADRAGKVMGIAAETFNDGLRAYYLSFAVVCWFFSPHAFAISSVAVLLGLYRREFKSDVLQVLSNGQQ